MKNFRKRKFTSRTKPITQNQIERLRATRMKNATNYAQKRFYSSGEFDKQIRRNVRTNRAKANMKQLDKIVKKIGGTKEQENVVRSLFGEKFSIVNGKRVYRNTFTSQSQTKRLRNIATKIRKKKFNLKRYIQNSQQYKDIKQYLPDDADTSDIVYALSRSGFYFENKALIIRHNKNVQKYGFMDAQTKSAGIDLRNKHYETQNKENQDLIDFFEKE